MTLSVKDIERTIESLPQEDWHELDRWMADYKFRKWDDQIEGDLAAGRLDAIVAEAEAEWEARIEADAKAGKFDAIVTAARARHKAGQCRPLSADFPVPDSAGGTE